MNTASGRWLRQHASLPDLFFAPQDTSSTRLEVVDEALMGVLNDVRFFAVEASSASTVTVHVTPHLMVSARTTQLRAIDRLRESVKAGEPFASPPDLLAHLLRDQADVLSKSCAMPPSRSMELKIASSAISARAGRSSA